MPRDRLSDEDRLRLAELMKAPLVSTASPAPKPPKLRLPRWNGWSISRVKHHMTAHWRKWAAAGAAGLGCLLLLAAMVELGARREDNAAKLRVNEAQGQLQIHWDPESDAVRSATDAKLFITDGPERLFVNLDGQRLRRGTVSYARQSGRVELRLTLVQPDGRAVEQSAVFFGLPVPEEGPRELSASAESPSGAFESPKPVEARPIEPSGLIEHRSRRKPVEQSGTRLPFTCAAGDVFRKTDAPQGWDTFTCKGKNVWSVTPAHSGEDRSIQRPNSNATTLTAKPASTSTT